MSADNYYVVRKHPKGGFTFVQAFASDDDPDLTPRITDQQFFNIAEAFHAAQSEYSEYGTEIDPECFDYLDFAYTDRNTLEHTDVTLFTHAPEQCLGEYCTIHNRSDHSMRSFPQNWRGDRGIMERICPHGIGHPDPDEYKLTLSPHEGIHGCDGCCQPKTATDSETS